MLIGDTNKDILMCNGKIIITRLESNIIYDENDMNKQITEKHFKLPRSFNDKIYDYSSNKITAYSVSEDKKQCLVEIISKEFNFGAVKDFYKTDKNFFFVKSTKPNKHSLFSKNSTANSILDFDMLYNFSNGFICALIDKTVIKMNLKTGQKVIMKELEVKPLQMRCETSNELNQNDGNNHSLDNDIIVITDNSNRIHIFYKEIHRQYHWLSNKAESIAIHDDFVIVASKDEKIAKFHTKINKIQMIAEFMGSFISMKITNNKIYLLTSVQFLIYNLETENIVFSEFLLPWADFKVVKICPQNKQDEDIFKLKKQSIVEINNICGKYIRNFGCKIDAGNSIKSNSLIGYTHLRGVFLYDWISNKFASFFMVDSEINFISENKLISCTYRKRNMIVKLFTIYHEKLVLDSLYTVSADKKLNIKNIFYIKEKNTDKIFLLIEDKIFTINSLNLLEEIKHDLPILNIKQSEGTLEITDEKGIFDVFLKKYLLKQKKVLSHVKIGENLIINIEDKGLYVDNPDRKLILDKKCIIDMQIIKKKIEKDEEIEEDAIGIIYLEDGKYHSMICNFDNKKNILTIEQSKIICPLYHRILAEELFMAKSGQLFYDVKNLN